MNKHEVIHPTINKLDITDEVKRYFSKLELYEIIEDPIVLSTDAQEVDESRANQWSFGVSLKYCNAHDIKSFYKSLINARTSYLLENNFHTKMIFYTWYDQMSGNFYFSIIPENWSKLQPGQALPFGCTINKVNSLEKIISLFLKDKYKGVIPFEELKEGDPSYETDEEEEARKNILDVWATIL